ncbi:WS/DGAT domain-containing protein [Mycobacterium sp. CVI_P3]|uniref:WS/DGAT domain-containing protein n=1 Tax=Mycobacterium pinniadriaticum TaxID=2994102 RepID=A0ABT3SG13_9MYCO|nr:WS/DGAT domain-containing protein [Mycobacterium pinniadriaticum]MCX2932027.1 WS/DGAT domain-containing protein [Mycobacterium pinniadriaticum]MCX2938451.1 WS/DGAT domain-containing protein [Mycobacterium pinniadriaticum]
MKLQQEADATIRLSGSDTHVHPRRADRAAAHTEDRGLRRGVQPAAVSARIAAAAEHHPAGTCSSARECAGSPLAVDAAGPAEAGVNITVWSYAGMLNFAVYGCVRTLPDADLFTQRIQAAFDELPSATGISNPSVVESPQRA